MSDTITITTGTAGVAGNVSVDLQTYFAAKLLEVAEYNLVLDQFGEKVPLPPNSSQTIRFNRVEKLTLTTSPSELTQGEPPDADGLTLNQYEATVEQYGKVVRLSDLAELTAKHQLVQKAIYVLGLHASETYDILIYNVLDAASNEYRPNGILSDATLLAGSLITYEDLIQLNATLAGTGAKPIKDGLYALVVCPMVHAGLLKDPDFKAANQFVGAEKIFRGQVGQLGGTAVVQSNAPSFAVTTQTGSGYTNKVYSSFYIGNFAYQITDLQSVQVYVAGPGGWSDPLHQSRKIGYKFAFKAKITNENWIRRVRSSGLDSATV